MRNLYTASIFIRPLMEVLQGSGEPWQDIFQRHGVEVVAPRIDKDMLNAESTTALLNEVGARLQDPCLGISLARASEYAHFGALGYSVAAGGTLLSILQRIVRFNLLITNVVTTRLDIEAEVVVLSFERTGRHIPHPQAILFVLACIVRLLRGRVGRDLHPCWLQIPRELHHAQSDVRQFFKCQVRNGGGFEMGFERRVAEQLLKCSDLGVASALDVTLQQRLKQIGLAQWITQLMGWIESRLPEGEPRLADAAAYCHMGVRTLQRKLNEELFSWQQLVELVRRNVVERHLGVSDSNITELAFATGYTEVSSFSRAFKKWYGVSPAKWSAERQNETIQYEKLIGGSQDVTQN